MGQLIVEGTEMEWNTVIQCVSNVLLIVQWEGVTYPECHTCRQIAHIWLPAELLGLIIVVVGAPVGDGTAIVEGVHN